MKFKFLKLFGIYLLCFTSLSCAILERGQRRIGSSDDFSTEPLRVSPISSYINQITNALVKQESPEKIGFKTIDVRILKTSRIQGQSYFDLPEIYITRGMLNVLTNEAELACLIGHEIGHKVLHKKNQHYKSKGSLKEIFLPEEILESEWSKKREQEADEYGTILCKKAGYDPYAFLSYFERLSQFQKGGFFVALEKLTATHKDFKNRAKHLQKYLEKLGIQPGGGFIKPREYRTALVSLGAVHTDDVVNEILPGGPSGVLERLNKIEEELRKYQQKRESISVEHFLKTMEELSKILHQYGISKSLSNLLSNYQSSLPAPDSFMKEVVSQDTPVWLNHDELEQKAKAILGLLGRLGVGFIPVAGDAVDLYEFLRGEEFGTGHSLTFNERTLTAAGLLAGSGKAWRVAQGMEQTLKEATLAKRLGRRTAADADRAFREAQSISETIKNKRLVIGKLEDLNKPGMLKPLEYRLEWPGKGNPKLNWKENSRFLRLEMRFKRPIRDISPARGGGFLEAERNLLKNYGWSYDKTTSHWHPPGK